MIEPTPVTVFLVDDEPEVAAALVWLLDSVKITSRALPSGAALLQMLSTLNGPACAVLDLRMPEMSGLELLQRMHELGYRIPVLFLSAHGDVPAAVNAMQLGAIDFLQKPFNSQAFLNSVNRAVRLAREAWEQRSLAIDTRSRLARLSEREKDVLRALLDSRTSKEIAKALGISPKTVDVHRANVMRKFEASTYRDLLNKVRGDQISEPSRPKE